MSRTIINRNYRIFLTDLARNTAPGRTSGTFRDNLNFPVRELRMFGFCRLSAGLLQPSVQAGLILSEHNVTFSQNGIKHHF